MPGKDTNSLGWGCFPPRTACSWPVDHSVSAVPRFKSMNFPWRRIVCNKMSLSLRISPGLRKRAALAERTELTRVALRPSGCQAKTWPDVGAETRRPPLPMRQTKRHPEKKEKQAQQVPEVLARQGKKAAMKTHGARRWSLFTCSPAWRGVCAQQLLSFISSTPRDSPELQWPGPTV